MYLSDKLNRKRIPSARASVGISVSDGILTLDLDTGEFPAGELEALYQSLLRKKKYHRLTDGRFLTLDGSSYETLAEMTHMLQLPAKELEKGSLKIPAFRGLYLDSVLAGREDLNVTRDSQHVQGRASWLAGCMISCLSLKNSTPTILRKHPSVAALPRQLPSRGALGR